MSEARAADARAAYRQAFEDFANDRIEAAIEGFRRAVELDPRYALAWNGLSTACRRQGDLDAAIDAAKKLVELEPDDPLSHTNLSILYQSKGMIPEAEEEKALSMQLEAKRGA